MGGNDRMGREAIDSSGQHWLSNPTSKDLDKDREGTNRLNQNGQFHDSDASSNANMAMANICN